MTQQEIHYDPGYFRDDFLLSPDLSPEATLEERNQAEALIKFAKLFANAFPAKELYEDLANTTNDEEFIVKVIDTITKLEQDQEIERDIKNNLPDLPDEDLLLELNQIAQQYSSKEKPSIRNTILTGLKTLLPENPEEI